MLTVNFYDLHAARRGTRQGSLKKVTVLNCTAARGTVNCAVDITNPNNIKMILSASQINFFSFPLSEVIATTLLIKLQMKDSNAVYSLYTNLN